MAVGGFKEPLCILKIGLFEMHHNRSLDMPLGPLQKLSGLTVIQIADSHQGFYPVLY